MGVLESPGFFYVSKRVGTLSLGEFIRKLYTSYEILHVASCSHVTHKWSMVLGLG